MSRTGIGHRPKQQSFFQAQSLSYGGSLRNRRSARGRRPLSGRDPIHCVFKLHRHQLRHRSLRSARGLRVTMSILRGYARRFFVKIEQVSVQGNHIHLLIRASKRCQFQSYFRVVAGQIAQRFAKEGLLVTDTPNPNGKLEAGLWNLRPFSRVVKGRRGLSIVRKYIQLNELEGLGLIPYQKERLRGLTQRQWEWINRKGPG